MSNKKIIFLVTAATLIFSNCAFALSWQDATYTHEGIILDISSDSRNDQTKINVEMKVLSVYKGSYSTTPNCFRSADVSIFSITNSGYATTGTVQQQNHEFWKNSLLLAKAKGARIVADFSSTCELYDLRLK